MDEALSSDGNLLENGRQWRKPGTEDSVAGSDGNRLEITGR